MGEIRRSPVEGKVVFSRYFAGVSWGHLNGGDRQISEPSRVISCFLLVPVRNAKSFLGSVSLSLMPHLMPHLESLTLCFQTPAEEVFEPQKHS